MTELKLSDPFVSFCFCLRKNFIFLQVGYKALSYEYFRQKAQYDSGALMGELSDGYLESLVSLGLS